MKYRTARKYSVVREFFGLDWVMAVDRILVVKW